MTTYYWESDGRSGKFQSKNDEDAIAFAKDHINRLMIVYKECFKPSSHMITVWEKDSGVTVP